MRRFLPVMLLLALLAACAAPPPPPPAPPPERATFSETGIASWYGPHHQGRLTANGERFDQRDFTAANRNLPFDTVLRVTNLDNGRSVKVRVNDRGPYVKGRILDLSAAAATALGMRKDGIAHVRLEIFASDQPRSRTAGAPAVPR
ncbi:MAG TPA: septal ring lytic transglycosylase RlpA family protein [Stellaceae bacterium]|nr:septal ring lytic transglycosylase RlpA family protein [Stellaceae bacterium]